ncbi:hypothetical protein PG994_005202 [Apiospora phragmitis]|uniref:Alpha/beta hydrolase fold-3 domain-containing protein n=1 Tax=Apiospora phragmitis TaxID=2905665 RepID=A0ABR1VST7_9PEZI
MSHVTFNLAIRCRPAGGVTVNDYNGAAFHFLSTGRRGPPLPWLARQPLSSIYSVCYLATVLPRIPYWTLKFALFPRLRPIPTWTLKQSLMATLTKPVLHGACVTETPAPLSLEPGQEKDRFCIAQPGSETDYVGPLRSAAVAPAPVGITCFLPTDKPSKSSSLPSSSSLSSMVMLHVHGGAFVIGDGRTATMGFGASMLLRHAGVDRVYSPQYRLACRPDPVPFPGALQDVLTSYLYLVRELGIPAKDIVLSGDSAGGNLIIGLLRYLAEHSTQLHNSIPLPHSAVLISPWVAPVNNLGPDVVLTSNPHYGTDILPPSFLRWGAAAYARLVPASDPYISPLGRPFVTPVRLFVSFGAAEVLEIDGARWVREMQEVVALLEEEEEDGGKEEEEEEAERPRAHDEDGAPHDTLLVGGNLGFEDSVREVTTKVGEFIRRKPRASLLAN